MAAWWVVVGWTEFECLWWSEQPVRSGFEVWVKLQGSSSMLNFDSKFLEANRVLISSLWEFCDLLMVVGFAGVEPSCRARVRHGFGCQQRRFVL